ncbi:MAG: DUF4340 domain-containing protein [Phycisphaerales bacterium]
MSNQKLGVLAVVAAVMVLLAAISSRTPTAKRAKLSGPAYLIQGLDPSSIDHITVGYGKSEVKIGRRNNQFFVTDINYPADAKQINDLITKTLDIKTGDLYTTDAKNHEDLEVTEEKARGLVKFFKADGTLLAGVVVGKGRESGQGAYVRQASSDDVYVADEAPYFGTRALDYVNQEIATIRSEDVNTVTVATPEGSYTLHAQKSGDGVVFEGLPDEKKLKESEAKSVFTALQGLRFDDVNTPAQIEGLTFDHLYVVRMDNSTEYTLELAKKGAKTYLKARAVYTDPAKVTINPEKQDSPEELKKKEAILLAQEGAQRFTLRHKVWVYEIPDWKAKYLTKPQSELLEDKEAKPAEAKVDAPPALELTLPTVPAVQPDQPIAAPAVEPNQPVAAPQAAEPNKPVQ